MKNIIPLIALSGKIGSGKDTVGTIIQLLSYSKQMSNEMIADIVRDDLAVAYGTQGWHRKKFADKLKKFASQLTGISVSRFEDQEFKKNYLGDQWSYWTVSVIESGKLLYQSGRFATKEEAEAHKWHLDTTSATFNTERVVGKHQMTVRQLLQELGTEAMRMGLHPDVWVNALFADYVPVNYKMAIESDEQPEDAAMYPRWIITDCRFPNEANAVVKAGGIVVRVNRDNNSISDETKQHASETALDDYAFEYVIDNNATLEELVQQVRELMDQFKIQYLVIDGISSSSY